MNVDGRLKVKDKTKFFFGKFNINDIIFVGFISVAKKKKIPLVDHHTESASIDCTTKWAMPLKKAGKHCLYLKAH
jgi:ABC-type uncharacterized transport system substrate-binding protein